MQKTRSLLVLREVLDQLDHDDSTELSKNVSFRDKDLLILQQQCRQKHETLTLLQQTKQKLNRKVLELKEQLCELNPEALQEIERDCERNGNSEDGTGRQKVGGLSKGIKKRGQKRKKRKQRLFYD